MVIQKIGDDNASIQIPKGLTKDDYKRLMKSLRTIKVNITDNGTRYDTFSTVHQPVAISIAPSQVKAPIVTKQAEVQQSVVAQEPVVQASSVKVDEVVEEKSNEKPIYYSLPKLDFVSVPQETEIPSADNQEQPEDEDFFAQPVTIPWALLPSIYTSLPKLALPSVSHETEIRSAGAREQPKARDWTDQPESIPWTVTEELEMVKENIDIDDGLGEFGWSGPDYAHLKEPKYIPEDGESLFNVEPRQADTAAGIDYLSAKYSNFIMSSLEHVSNQKEMNFMVNELIRRKILTLSVNSDFAKNRKMNKAVDAMYTKARQLGLRVGQMADE